VAAAGDGVGVAVRAAQISVWGGPLELVERPEPEPANGEVLVDVEACGVGLTVLNYIRGDLGNDSRDLPRVPGHELAGTVTAVGAGADEALVGQRVVAYFYLSCGTCRQCLAGFEPLCERLAGNVGVHCDGGYAERCVLPAFNVLTVPPAIDAAAATTVPDAIATPVHIARRTGLGPGRRVAVVGAGGGVGIHMVQVAKAFGADVAGLDHEEAKLNYLERELGVGAIDSSDFGKTKLPAAWNTVDVVVDFVGTRDSLEWGVARLGRNGTLVSTTTFRGVTFEVSPRDLVFSQASVVGSRYASRYEVGLAASLVLSGRVQPVVGRRVDVDGLESLHEELRQGTLLGRGALVWRSDVAEAGERP
jgi:D-arabinose 1-dehydrogenase-like Zn-dependent alcohol dehydrogenase